MVSSVQTLQLVKRRDADNSDIDSVDLMSVPVELQYEGWEQGTPSQQGQSSVDEVITLLMNAGNANTLATALQSIDSKVKQTQWAQDPLNPIGVWLRTKLATETNTRQAFIQELRRSPALPITDPLMYDSTLQKYQLGVTRMPVWENPTASSIAPGSITANGGTFAYSVSGDAHARVSKLQITGKSVSAAADLYREAWFGAKSDRYGVTPANFVPVWNVAAQSFSGTDMTQVSDATALSGYKLVTAFTDRTMAVRVLSRVLSFTSNYSDQRGKYNMLARLKTSDASLRCNVRACMGYASTANLAYLPRLPISAANGGWKWYTLGTVKIPATEGFFEQSLEYSSVGIAGEWVSGTGNLEVDSFALIPAEHSIHVLYPDALGFGTLTGSQMDALILTRPDLKMYAIVYTVSDGKVQAFAQPDAISWSLPTGTNNIIAGVVQSTYSVTTDTMTPALTIYPSYSSLRGNV